MVVAALVVSICAVLFTAASFWWLNARRGTLKSWEPHSYAAYWSAEVGLLRLPLVVYGAAGSPYPYFAEFTLDYFGARKVHVFHDGFEGWKGPARIRDEKFSLQLRSNLPYLVVYTPQHKDYFCVEPVSHVGNAIHMADPAKLLAGAGRLYGAEMDRLYGSVLPVPEDNLRPLEGGEIVTIGKRDFEILYTPGHASHHLTFWDAQDGTAFIGDAGGISVEGDEFILPATPPPDIDIEIWNQSLDAIAALRPAKLFLTHFGYANDPHAHIKRYRERLANWSAMVRDLLAEGKTEEAAAQEFVDAVAGETKHAVSSSEADHYIFNGGLYLSWLGLLRYTKKRAQKNASAP